MMHFSGRRRVVRRTETGRGTVVGRGLEEKWGLFKDTVLVVPTGGALCLGVVTAELQRECV